eukprot:1714740-Amphidinium_carterae.2
MFIVAESCRRLDLPVTGTETLFYGCEVVTDERLRIGIPGGCPSHGECVEYQLVRETHTHEQRPSGLVIHGTGLDAQQLESLRDGSEPPNAITNNSRGVQVCESNLWGSSGEFLFCMGCACVSGGLRQSTAEAESAQNRKTKEKLSRGWKSSRTMTKSKVFSSKECS